MHAVAIRLRDERLGDHVIAVALEIDVDQVPTLLQIADSKLANLMALDVPSSRIGRTDRPHATQPSRCLQPGKSLRQGEQS